MATQSSSTRRTRKVAALAAGALVIGIGAAYTLASWNDSEWVWGGADGGPGVGTSSFEVQQDTSAPFSEPGEFGDFETNPGDELTFSTGALALAPGQTTYAPVALRTTADSVAGDVELQGAVPAAGISVDDDGGELWNAVSATVYTATGATPPSDCTTGFDSTGWTQIVTGAPLNTVADAAQRLQAESGSTQHYCFALTLSSSLPGGSDLDSIDQLQGRTIAPAWEFRSESVAP